MGAIKKDVLKKEVSASEFIPYSSHVTPNIIKLLNGDFMAVIKFEGAAHESADASDLNAWHNQLNNFMRNLASPNFSIWSHVVRRKYNAYPKGDFEGEFVTTLNDKYKDSFATRKMFVNELYLTIIYRPELMPMGNFLKFLNKKSKEDLIDSDLDAIESLTEAVNNAYSSLWRYEPEILGTYQNEKGFEYSQVLEFLGFLINGFWSKYPMPRASINKILATSRPFFGKGGLMSIKTPTETQYCSMLTIQEYPSATVSGLLDDLLSLPCELVLTQSFSFLSKTTALNRMTRQQGRMVNAGDVAESQISAIDDALDDLSSNRFVMGTHHFSLLVRGYSQKELNDLVGECGTVMSEAGMKWGREDVGMAAAFYSQLPANFDLRVRAAEITSRNFAGFSPLHNFPIGKIEGNQWGNAITAFKTTSGAPYYFNFHKGETDKNVKIDPEHKDLANTLIIGQSGSGKTVLQTFLLAQTQKFKGKPMTCVFFDKDLGASIAVRAMGGRYYPLKNGSPSGFNPFQLEETANNLVFLEQFVKSLVHREDSTLTPRQEREISEAIAGVYGLPQELRNISSLLDFFTVNEEGGIHERLLRWKQGQPLGWMFDNAEDTLNLDAPIVGFDVTEFLENPETRTPTLLYLFHRIEKLIDGRRIPIFMDEIWRLLDDSTFADLIKNKLVTIRKQDGFLIMGTQSPAQVVASPIAFALIEQTATKIFLPNPQAKESDYIDNFKLTAREYEIVKDLGEKSRQFLVKQGENSVVCELDLKGFNDELAVLSGNTSTAGLVEKLVETHGENPSDWLPAFHEYRKAAH